MKKIFAIFFSLLIFLLGGCVIRLGNGDIIQIDPPESYEQADIVLNAFKTGETEELQGLFCKKIADSHDLESELSHAIAFIDGKIVSVGRCYPMCETGSMYKDGVKVDSHISPSFEKIKTDTNHYYDIAFFSYLIYAGDEDCVGMTELTVVETDKKGHLTEPENRYTVGEAIYYYEDEDEDES